MVRFTRALKLSVSRALRLGLGGKDQPEMGKVNMHMPGFDWASIKHNWSLLPLFVCGIIGGIAAVRYTWHLGKPSKDTEGYKEPHIFYFKFFHDKQVPVIPETKKKEQKKKD